MTDRQALELYARTRDAQAFHTLVVMYHRLVYATASRRLARREDAEDVAQQTFMKLAQSAALVQQDIAAWLYRTALNTAADVVRRDATRRRYEADVPVMIRHETETPDHAAEWRELAQRVDDAIAALPAEQQSLIVAQFFAGRAQRDVASELGVSQPTVQRRTQQAIDALREHLSAAGYTAAPAVVTEGLGQLAGVDVPRTLVAGLSKIGLAGAPARAAGWSAMVGVKASSLVAGAAAVIVGVTVAVVGLDPPATAPATQLTPTPATTPATAPVEQAPPDASLTPLQRLSRVYTLEPGQVLRMIPPPFPPEGRSSSARSGRIPVIRTIPRAWDLFGMDGSFNRTISRMGKYQALLP